MPATNNVYAIMLPIGRTNRWAIYLAKSGYQKTDDKPQTDIIAIAQLATHKTAKKPAPRSILEKFIF